MIDDPDIEPFALLDLVPHALRGVLLNITWDSTALFALRLPEEHIDISSLRWQLDLPWWRDGTRFFAVTPNEVRQTPTRYLVQWQRTLEADLAYPIHVVENGSRLTILDGVHRLLKADCENRATIAARRLTMDDVLKIARRRNPH